MRCRPVIGSDLKRNIFSQAGQTAVVWPASFLLFGENRENSLKNHFIFHVNMLFFKKRTPIVQKCQRGKEFLKQNNKNKFTNKIFFHNLLTIWSEAVILYLNGRGNEKFL